MGPMCSIVYENEPAEKKHAKSPRPMEQVLIAKS
jgi:hypothetical protein